MRRLVLVDAYRVFRADVYLPRWLKRGTVFVGVPVAAVLLWAAFAPLPAGPREALYVVPKGTSARQAAGQTVSVLPSIVVLTVGIRDVLAVKNEDDVPVTVGPKKVAPGQTHREVFQTSAPYRLFPTSLRKDGLVIVVEPAPPPGWTRLAWRMRWW